MSTPNPTDVTPIMGHEVLEILAARGGRCPVAELKEAAAEAFGDAAVYGNCHGDLFDFDGLVAFLAANGKMARNGDVAELGWVPACGGH